MQTPLGKPTRYASRYSPDLLAPIPRAKSREAIGLSGPLPFHGVDIWNAWELTWLRDNGRPEVAALAISVPADTEHIVESKSLKLYLNSFSMSRFDGHDQVVATIETDLGKAVGGGVTVELMNDDAHDAAMLRELPGESLDTLDLRCDAEDVCPDLLQSDPSEKRAESLYSNLFRSLCPVTSQPDLASVSIRYSGPRIDHEGLLRYIVSFREHQDFHEACVERMFLDIRDQCGTESLSVYARFQRRGGIDINPWRSSEPDLPQNLRLWRQ